MFPRHLGWFHEMIRRDIVDFKGTVTRCDLSGRFCSLYVNNLSGVLASAPCDSQNREKNL
jgi:hypothetical protein